MKILAPSRIKNGQLTFNQRSKLIEDLKMLRDGEYLVTIEEKKKKRSLSQNAYLHLMLTLFTNALNELGNKFSMQEVKDMMKYKFLSVDLIDMETGQVLGTRVRGTSELNTFELNQFIEQVIQYAADMFHIVLPYPNEQLELITT